MQRRKQSHVEVQLGDIVYKHLYRNVMLKISPLIEELRERVNVAILYEDLQRRPEKYTEEEKEFITASHEAFIETQREFYKSNIMGGNNERKREEPDE